MLFFKKLKFKFKVKTQHLWKWPPGTNTIVYHLKGAKCPKTRIAFWRRPRGQRKIMIEAGSHKMIIFSKKLWALAWWIDWSTRISPPIPQNLSISECSEVFAHYFHPKFPLFAPCGIPSPHSVLWVLFRPVWVWYIFIVKCGMARVQINPTRLCFS